MPSFVCQIVIFSLLFVSIEGAADVVLDGVPHGSDSSHLEEFGHLLNAHDGEIPDKVLDGEHCEHCCHGHSVSIVMNVACIPMPASGSSPELSHSDFVLSLAQAPPTPPPNG